MKKHSISAEIAHVRAEILRQTPEQRMDVYGIRIEDDNSVYDTAEDKTYVNLSAWLVYYGTFLQQEWEAEQAEDEYDEYDEDY